MLRRHISSQGGCVSIKGWNPKTRVVPSQLLRRHIPSQGGCVAIEGWNPKTPIISSPKVFVHHYLGGLGRLFFRSSIQFGSFFSTTFSVRIYPFHFWIRFYLLIVVRDVHFLNSLKNRKRQKTLNKFIFGRFCLRIRNSTFKNWPLSAKNKKTPLYILTYGDRSCSVYFNPPILCPILEWIQARLQLFQCYNGIDLMES